MKKFSLFFFLICCFSAVAYGSECDQASCEIISPETCPVSDDCPSDSHPIGTPCPHDPS
jgi:hypothetical protein